VDRDKDKDKKNPRSSDSPVHSPEMEQLYRRLQPEMRRPKPSPDAIAAALESAQRLAAEADAEQAVDDTAEGLSADSITIVCRVCGYHNREGNKFCGMCGIAVPDPAAEESGVSMEDERQSPRALALPPNPFLNQDPAERPPATRPTGQETHHYHHHYHHHYFPGGEAMAGRYAPDSMRVDAARDDKLRPTAALRGDMSRAEAAVRSVTQEWVLACNTKHLDDLLELYTGDAIVLRSNCPPIRGASALREFFFGALDAGIRRSRNRTAARGRRRRTGLRGGAVQGPDSERNRKTPRRARQIPLGLRTPEQRRMETRRRLLVQRLNAQHARI